jgi:hypothetical protein
MSQSDGKKEQRQQFSPEDKATILRRHRVDRVPVSGFCDEYNRPRGALLPVAAPRL